MLRMVVDTEVKCYAGVNPPVTFLQDVITGLSWTLKGTNFWLNAIVLLRKNATPGLGILRRIYRAL